MCGLTMDTSILCTLLLKEDPLLYQHLHDQLQMPWLGYAVQHALTLFTESFASPVVWRVLDVIFFEGSHMTVLVLLAMLIHYTHTLCYVQVLVLLAMLLYTILIYYATLYRCWCCLPCCSTLYSYTMLRCTGAGAACYAALREQAAPPPLPLLLPLLLPGLLPPHDQAAILPPRY
jgi:hypothetical protein